MSHDTCMCYECVKKIQDLEDEVKDLKNKVLGVVSPPRTAENLIRLARESIKGEKGASRS